jgi:acetyl esterase/lipase
MKRRLFAVLIVPFLLQALAWAQPAQTDAKVEIERDLVYGKGGDVDLMLDMARPAGVKGPVPCIVCVHGGGWRFGSRQDLSKPMPQLDGKMSLIELLASKGYVAVSISYRLSAAAKFPAQIEDCKAAVRWLRANAKKYNIDPDWIGAVGFSAGGHLVCLMGAADKSDGLEGKGGNPDQSSRVQAVVSFFGPTDFTIKSWPEAVEKELLVPFLGASYDKDPAIYKKASPITYVNKNSPPFLFIHGTKDALVGIDQSEKMQKKLEDAGVSAQLIRMEGFGHGWGGKDALKSFDDSLKFFREKLKK